MIKEKYRDIPDDEFVSLEEGIDPAFLGKYEINKLGQIRGKVRKTKILDIGRKENLSYPKVTLSANRFRKSYFVHVLLAKNFLIPDKSYPPGTALEIDHVDRDKWNYSINNLRIVSRDENSKNKSKPKINAESTIKKYDLSWNLIEEVSSVNFSRSKMTLITRSIMAQKPYNGFYWEKESNSIKDYYSKFSKEQLESEIWKPSISLIGFEISSLGVLRKHIRGDYYRYYIGCRDHIGYLVARDRNNHRQPLHRLVAEAFIQGGKIPEGNVIDHIDGIKDNNCVENLRITTQAGNMNNDRTRQKLSKTVYQYSLDDEFIRSYKNREELTDWIRSHPEDFKSRKKSTESISIGHIYRCCSSDGKIVGFGYKWKYKGPDIV